MDPIEARFSKADQKIAKIVASAEDASTMWQLVRRRDRIYREYASKFIKLGYPQTCQSRLGDSDFEQDGELQICALWIVEGTFSKKGKPLAANWMRDRKIEWDGQAKTLRKEVESALLNGEIVPQFGLRIQLTMLRHTGIYHKMRNKLLSSAT